MVHDGCGNRNLPRTATPRRLLSLAVGACVLVAACAGSADDDAENTEVSRASEAPSFSTGTTPGTPTLDLSIVTDGSYDWRRVPIGAGGFVTGIVSQPGAGGAIYARTDVGGAYRWVDAEQRWVQLITAQSVPDPVADNGDFNVDSIATASTGQRVYAAVGGDYNPGPNDPLSRTGRILVSDDSGANWRTSTQRWFISGNQRFRVGSERLAVDPANPDRVLFGSSREGLWLSNDGGATWALVPEEQVPFGTTDDIAADQAGVSTTAFVGSLMVAGVAGVGVHLSTDGGTNWQLSRPVDAQQYPAAAVAVGEDLWVSINDAGGSNGGVAVHSPADGNWRDLSLPASAYFFSFAVDPADPQRVALADEAVRDGHFWTSSDGGSSWTEHDVAISAPDIPWLEATDLAGFMSTGRLMFDPAGGTLWFAEGMAVWRTDQLDDDEVLWHATANGIEETVTAAFLVPPGGDPLAVVADRQGFLLSDLERYPDRTLIDETFVGGTSIDASAGNPAVIAWVGAEYHLFYDDSRRARGAISRDGGATWTPFENLELEQFGGEIAVSATNPDQLVWVPSYFADPGQFAREPSGIYVSSDGGGSWTHLADVQGANSFHRLIWWFNRRALAADRVDGRFYLMSDESRFFASSDGGLTWAEAAHAPPCAEWNDCHVYGQVQAVPGAAGSLIASVGQDGLYRTDDAGATEWRKVPGVANARAFAFGAPMEADGPPTLYVHGSLDGEDTLGLLRSSDDGATWERIADFPGGLHAPISVIAADPEIAGRVYVGFAGVGFVQGDPAESPGG